ncbi:Fatty acyl-CoA reductase [Heracleum sosnowskyi]|uniref:Fatty acyl-CoA reductase n=1 Tax=Heracleum sosnowskyi TaxID=360622 RepID=A0AAD8HHE7_9APIA|nr:Fatty acyl-CoA reductase [Heracleum sosnowskyi]
MVFISRALPQLVEIVNTELFRRLREKHGTFFEKFILSKLVPVVGNMCETNLGVEEDVANCIAREVDAIINSAATTTVAERFDVALDLNMVAYASRQSEGKIIGQSRGKGNYVASSSDIFEAPHKHDHGLDIKAEIKLASEMKKSLKENEIDQKLKDFGMSWAQEYGWPNTYAFTKAMGEMVVEDIKGHLPVIIIRPSVIESTLKEPFPGWIEDPVMHRMIDPFMLLYGKGKIPGFYSDPNIALDVVPVDIVVNSTLAAIAKHGSEESKPEDSNSSDDHVYQITSSVANPLICRDLLDMAYQHFSLCPCFDRMGNPIHISAFKFFTSLKDFLSDMKNTNGNEKISPRKELIRRKSMEHLKYLAELYLPYSFFDGREVAILVPGFQQLVSITYDVICLFISFMYSVLKMRNEKNSFLSKQTLSPYILVLLSTVVSKLEEGVQGLTAFPPVLGLSPDGGGTDAGGKAACVVWDAYVVWSCRER